MKRSFLALIVIACLALALLIFDSVAPPSQIEFLTIAREQQHTLLLLLAAEAVLIAILTSGITEKPIPRAATIVAALTIFAAEIGQLNQSIPTGPQIAVVALIPIGIFFTNVIPIPKSALGKSALALSCSVVAIAGTWAIADTPAGPILGIIFGEGLVLTALTFIVALSWIVVMGSGFALVGLVIGQNMQTSKPIQWNDVGGKRRGDRGKSQRRK